MKNRRGSATILITMIAVALILAVCSSIGIARRITLRSTVNSYGSAWTRAILSEYDVHLFRDYGILAYHGSDAEVDDRLRSYMYYSLGSRLGSGADVASVDLSCYSMSDARNFRAALKYSVPSEIIESLIKGSGRKVRTLNKDEDDRVIRNRYVIDTLSSHRVDDSLDVKGLAEELEKGNILESIASSGGDAGREIAFVRKFMDNHVTEADDKEKFYVNEWEYIVAGKLSDEANYKACRNRIFLIRNALNLVALYKDPEKVELVTAAAELITPGPVGVVTQGVIMEAWAALEADEDLKTLLQNGRVPLIKTPGTWKISLENVLGSNDVIDNLDDESVKNLEEHRQDIGELDAEGGVAAEIREGQNYEDYLMFMMIAMNKEVRTLRIMDIVQIDMKLRYYRDFNWAEYYSGVAYDIKAAGKDIQFTCAYR